MALRSFRMCLLGLVLASCGQAESPAECEVPPSGPRTALIDKNVFRGRWRHEVVLLGTDRADSGFSVGDTSEPVEISWLFFEDQLAATDDLGLRFAVPVDEHFDVARTYAGTEPLCPLPRPWYDRGFAKLSWATDLVSAPDVVSFEPPTVELEAPSGVGELSFVFEPESGTAIAIRIPMAYRATADCPTCEPVDIVVEHRFLRLDGP